MVDPQTAAEAVLAALETIQGVSGAHDGYVPEKLPETDGYVDPYIVLWGGGGDGPGDLTADGRQDNDTLIWDFQTTAVGPTPAHCRQVDRAIKAKLTNLSIGRGRVRRNPDGFNQQTPILDNQVTPSRFFLPRQWRLITN